MHKDKKEIFERIMAEELSKMPEGPELEWFNLRIPIERELDVTEEIFRTWFRYEVGRLDACKRFFKNWDLNSRISNKNVLDIGCGHGQMLVAIAQNGGKGWGVDPDRNRVIWSKRRLKLHGIDGIIKEGSAERLPFENDSMDVVVLLHVFEHVNSYNNTLQEISRVLRHNGLLVIDAPNRFGLNNIKKDPHYNLPLICMFPPILGKLVVVNLLKLAPSYDVGLFPSCSGMNTFLSNNNFNPVEGTHTWMNDTHGWTKLKRWLRCNMLEGSFVVIAKNCSSTN